MKRTEHTQQWLDALRSGEYEQGKNYLFNKGTYCCLGVAGRIAGVDIGEYDGRWKAYDEILDKMGMSRKESGNITTMNDEDGLSFHEIANKIEEMLEPA